LRSVENEKLKIELLSNVAAGSKKEHNNVLVITRLADAVANSGSKIICTDSFAVQVVTEENPR